MLMVLLIEPPDSMALWQYAACAPFSFYSKENCNIMYFKLSFYFK